ncbi:hypothetical protein AVEN_76130-1 [Araneus ventricosus]|uniref:Uncharacterized protein n=1 Tax=Araneus ventricosus TaxID=182803 RepID=A0A4Y2IH04_ARAVE|nr:hypothetical protein AVEN_76130-1 [Araneus ventricosus]
MADCNLLYVCAQARSSGFVPVSQILKGSEMVMTLNLGEFGVKLRCCHLVDVEADEFVWCCLPSSGLKAGVVWFFRSPLWQYGNYNVIFDIRMRLAKSKKTGNHMLAKVCTHNLF